MCRFCGESQETFIHFLSDCPALWQERQEIFLDPLPRPIREDWKPDELVDFSFCKRITEALEADEVVRPTSDTSESESEDGEMSVVEQSCDDVEISTEEPTGSMEADRVQIATDGGDDASVQDESVHLDDRSDEEMDIGE